MAIDLERLAVVLEAQTRQFDTAMKRVDRVTRDTASSVDRNMARVETSISKAGATAQNFAKGFLVGAVTAGIGQLVSEIKGMVESLANVGDLADKLGTSTDFVQELQYGAVQANMDFGELENGLLKFSKTLAEARAGSGDYYSLLKANGMAVKQSFEENLDQVANLIRNAKDEQDQLLIATQAFGRGAASEYTEFLRNGSSGLKAFARDAHANFAVVEEDAIRSAQKIDDRWSAMWLSISQASKTAVVRTADYLAALDQYTSSNGPLAQGMAEFFASLVSSDQKLTDLQALTQKRETLVGQIADKMQSGELAIAKSLEAQLKAVNAEIEKSGQALDKIGRSSFPKRQSSDYSNEGLHAAPGDRSAPTTIVPNKTEEAEAKRLARERELALERQKKKIDDVINALKFENAQLVQSDLQQAINTELRRAGVSATSEQGRVIADLVKKNFELEMSEEAAIEAGKKALEADKAFAQSMRTFAEMGLDSFEQWAEGGADVMDVLRDLTKQLAKLAIQFALFGDGPFASLFGSSGGGFFGSIFKHASGGNVHTGRVSMVGEKGPELRVERGAGQIVSHQRMQNLMSGGGQGVQIFDQRRNAPPIERSQSGGSMKLVIRDAVRDVLPGVLQPVLAAQYGVTKKPTPR